MELKVKLSARNTLSGKVVELKVGDQAWAVIKASDVMIAKSA